MNLKHILGFFIVLFFVPFISFAIGGLYVTPLVENLHGAPGSQITFNTSITNQSNVQLTAVIAFRDFYIDSNGNYSMTTFASYTHSCAPWITTPSTAPVISAGQTIQVPFTITIPSNVSGEYFATILINNTAPNQTGNIIVGVNTAVLITLKIDNMPMTYQAQFKGVKLYSTTSENLPSNFPSGLKNSGIPYVLEMDYTNTGNSVIGLDGQFRLVSDTLHQIVYATSLARQETLAFPGITRTIWIPINRIVPNGDYRILLSANLGNGIMTSQSFSMKVTDQKISPFPFLSTDKYIINIPFQVPNAFLNANFNIQSLDYRISNVKFELVGMKQSYQGLVVEAPLDQNLFGNLKVYPDPMILYPYSIRNVVIAGKGPSTAPASGEYYALLKLNESVSGGEATTVEIPIILSVGKLTKSIALENFKVTPDGSNVDISVDVKNTGNSMTYYAGEIFITDATDHAVNSSPAILNIGILYSGATVYRTMTLPFKVSKGYTVRLVMYYFNDQTFKNTATVSVQQKIN
ncbi:hypothetical protein [Athalassotoga saccharophila]|uniref:hypothetical protein n=1 Tax=Athalassotoga saccharophila TaxID=1441386 RepID=UPI0013793DBA|nr:hypothetical protein [Athalassotoga saccharophila]BBJ28971.1 hypothetical protein ATHSA_1896 [Athalassotoga saccharophila]